MAEAISGRAYGAKGGGDEGSGSRRGGREAAEQAAGAAGAASAAAAGAAGPQMEAAGGSGSERSHLLTHGSPQHLAAELLLGRDVLVDVDDPATYLGHGGWRAGRGWENRFCGRRRLRGLKGSY
jgi:hypothetical protein